MTVSRNLGQMLRCLDELLEGSAVRQKQQDLVDR